MGKWLRIGAVALLLGLTSVVIGVEITGRVATERVAENRLRANGVRGSIEVTIGSAWWRPTFLPALATGTLDRVSVGLDGAELYAVPVLKADYVLEDLQVQVSPGDRSIAATSIGSGSVRVLIDPAEIGAMFGTEAALLDGRLVIGPERAPADLQMLGDDLVLSGPSLASGSQAASFRVADPQLLPCTPGVRLLNTLVELFCTGDELPGILERPLGPSGGSSIVPPPAELEPPLTLESPTTAPTNAPTNAPTTAPTTTTPVGGNDGGG